ncbi:MAG: NRDE family protein [Flammeovirgaceae bacterium]
MCLIFFAVQKHPTYKLIIAANRDEFYNRKTVPADFWENHPAIVGGRDLEARRPDGSCGTWMAMNTNGRVAMVTNYRDPKNIDPQAPSRGHLVSDYLEGAEEPETYLQRIKSNRLRYNGYNLVVGNVNELWYLSNYQNEIMQLANGLHGLSNHWLDTPWPKVRRGKEKFGKELTSNDLSANTLFNFLYDTDQADDSQLPDTGIGLERERILSSMFIKTNGYGTRCSTVVMVDKQNIVEYTERVYDLNTFEFEDRTFRFQAD